MRGMSFLEPLFEKSEQNQGKEAGREVSLDPVIAAQIDGARLECRTAN